MSERNSDPEKEYEEALDAALERAGDRLAEIHREIESAAGLLEELAATPAPERPERVRTEVRFHALKLCDLLLKRSRESWFRDPAGLRVAGRPPGGPRRAPAVPPGGRRRGGHPGVAGADLELSPSRAEKPGAAFLRGRVERARMRVLDPRMRLFEGKMGAPERR